MAEHQGPDGPDAMRAAVVDDTAQALLSAWDAAREQATPRLSWPQLNALLVVERSETDLVIGPDTSLSVVDGILSGMHEPGSSHFSLLGAFAAAPLLGAAAAHAERAGYLIHELGDSTLVV